MWFNYLWIVILVMCIIGFILYTLLSFYSDYKRVLKADAHRDWCTCSDDKKEVIAKRAEMPFYKIFPLVHDEFVWRHEEICIVWRAVFVVTIVIMFAVSFAFWLKSLSILEG